MRHQLTLLGLLLVAAPAPSGAADAASAAGGPYAVLKAAPPAPRPGCTVTRAEGGELRAALFSRETAACPVARVAGDEITLDELAGALEGSHLAKGSRASRGGKARAIDFAAALDRLVDVRLLVLEARETGLVEQAEYRQAQEAFRASTLRTMLQEQAAAGVKPDRVVEERLFRAAAKQWKVQSVLFEQEAGAAAFRAEVARGGTFDALARRAVADKKARGGEPGWVPAKEMVPELASAADALKAGQVSAPVKVAGGWVVLRLEAVRYPEDKAAREPARAAALAEAQHRAVRRFHESLVKKYAQVDEKALAALDLEVGGEAGFKQLLEDRRPLATIRDEAPVTVAEVTREISTNFFHGIADPIKEHRVNKAKADTFDLVLGARLFAREARERKLAQRPGYLHKVAEFDRVLAFNTFLERVIVPEVKVTEADVQALYQARKGQLSTPQMYRLEGVAFGSAQAAQAALEKLQGGTDLEWLRANGEGQLKPEAQQLAFQGTLLSVNGLPPSLVKALTGARSGELRRYATDDGAQHYVLRVADQVAPGVQPYADAREKLAREVEAEKLGEAVRAYAARLRTLQKVDVIIARIAG